MNVKTTEDYDDIPAGSFLRDVERVAGKDDLWRALWCSMWGSYYVLVPKSICEEIKSES